MTTSPTPMSAASAPAVALRLSEPLWERMTGHVLGVDGEEHGGALLCGLARDSHGRLRLLGRKFVPALDSIDYVPSRRGHRALTPSFIRAVTRTAAEQGLACLLVHGHGHGDRVGFSAVDMASHERGYPALLDLSDGAPVGALVLASHAVAGDIWLPGGGRADVKVTTVIGANVRHLHPRPAPSDPRRPTDDRQARVFGDAGQHVLRHSKIAVIGAGGAGMLAIEWLSRLGVGELVVIDPDRVELTNLARLPGATRRDCLPWLTSDGRPAWLQRLGRRFARRKVSIAVRLAQQAGRGTTVAAFTTPVQNCAASEALLTCDYIVLAADSAYARLITNTVCHQYLIPVMQVGVKVAVDAQGDVGDIVTLTRSILPEASCLQCSGLIDATQLSLESQPAAQARLADYGTGQPAPAVISLNAIAVSNAVTRMLFALTGLNAEHPMGYLRQHPRTGEARTSRPFRDVDCASCGSDGLTGLGDLRPLPTTNN